MMSPPTERGPVLILGRSLNIGGAERQMVQLAIGLKDRGYDVVVALFYGGGVLEADLAKRGIPIRNLAKKHRWDIGVFMVRLIATIRQVRPSIVYSFLGTANSVAAAARPFVPAHRLLWSVRASNMNLGHYGWVSRLGYRAECALASVPDCIISNSQAGLDYAAGHGFPRSSMVVVPNGIDTERFRPDRDKRRAFRERWRIAEHEIAVGVMARLDPMKDHDTFLRAAKTVAEWRPDVRFLCIGEGESGYVDKLQQLTAALGLDDRLQLTGPVTDAPGALNALDLLCSSSSEGEGFSNTVGEAMACGVPCVVTDVGDSAMIVGDTGLVVPPRDPERMADALIRGIERLGPATSIAFRNRICHNFSVDRMVERTIACF